MTGKKIISSFTALNVTQFLTTLNDNIYKLLLVFFLICTMGKGSSNTILSLAGAVFVIPFLLFAPIAGTLADRFSKQRIILFSLFYEIFVVSLAILFFAIQSAIGSYIVLFLMALLSTLFSPCKYGILPEIVKREKISHYNGLLTSTTYMAIILGTFLASFLADITKRNYLISVSICVLIAIVSLFFSLGIEKTAPQAEEKKVSPNYFSFLTTTFKSARRIRYLLPSIFFAAFFLFMGSFVQLNIIPFTIQSLNLSEIEGGYLFLLTAIGIGVGSFLSGRFSGKEVELGFVPLAALGISLTLAALFFFQHHFFVIAPLLIVVGFFGGFYIIPLETFIQISSPAQDRGQNVASSNFLSFLGVLFASFLLAFFGNFLGFSAAEGFLAVGIMTFFVFIILTFILADQLFRFTLRLFAPFWTVKVTGRRLIQYTPAQLIVAPRLSYVDTLILMAILPRMIRYVIPMDPRLKKQKSLLRLLRVIPVDIGIEPEMLEIHQEMELGHSVCLMLPSALPITHVEGWGDKLEKIRKNFNAPLIAVSISRKRPEKKGVWREFFSLFKTPITLSYRKINTP